MSYSFIVRAADKAKAKSMVAAEIEKVVQTQPGHFLDRKQTLAVACAFVDLLEDDDSRHVHVNMSGWIALAGPDDSPTCNAVSLSLTATRARP